MNCFFSVVISKLPMQKVFENATKHFWSSPIEPRGTK